MMKEQDLNHCARAFERERLDGTYLLELPREEFTLIFKEIGGIAYFQYNCLYPILRSYQITGVSPTTTRQEWRHLQAYIQRARETAGIAKIVKNADILKSRIADRVSEARTDFTGRAWLAKLLVTSLDSLSPQKAILITGVGGTGKSYFFDRLLDTVTCNMLAGDWAWLNRRMLARHCCMFKHSDSLSVKKFLDSLIAQLLHTIRDTGRTFTLDDEDKTPVDKLLYDHLKTAKHTEASTVAGEVLVPALEAIGSAEALGGKCVVLVDSLDEARTVDKNVIVPVFVNLIEESPDWLRWVATSRPDEAVKTDIKPVAGDTIELSLEGENQEADIREYVQTELERVSGLEQTSEKVTVISKKAGGLFKYAVMAVKKIKADPNTDVQALPKGLDEMLLSYFTRRYNGKLDEYDKYTAPMLAIMVATFDAVPSDLVKGDRRGSRKEWVKLEESWQFVKDTICQKALLSEDKSSNGNSLMQFGHKSILDFLQNQDDAGKYWVDIRVGHTLLADRCKDVLLKLASEPTHPCMEYTLRHLVKHLCYLHEHPYQHTDGVSRPDPLQEAAHVVLSFDWLIGRLLIDKDTQGVVEDMDRVRDLLEARSGDGDAGLAKCIDDVRVTLASRSTSLAVRHDPRQIMGRIMLELSDNTRTQVIELVKQTRECKRFPWWYLRKEGTLTMMGGKGPKLTCVGAHAFRGKCTDGMGSVDNVTFK